MEVRVDLARIIISDTRHEQIIILQERDGERNFPVLIGIGEAQAINRRIKSEVPQRPMTHELLANVIESLDAELKKVVICDLKEHTFFAKLVMRTNGKIVEIDSRPSDAIALAVGAEVPLFVEESVLKDVSRESTP
jgi:hypothetical protein